MTKEELVKLLVANFKNEEHIKVPVYYFFDGDDVVIDEESMYEVFKEEILKVSHFLNVREKGK